jgi:hypothetical protein
MALPLTDAIVHEAPSRRSLGRGMVRASVTKTLPDVFGQFFSSEFLGALIEHSANVLDQEGPQFDRRAVYRRSILELYRLQPHQLADPAMVADLVSRVVSSVATEPTLATSRRSLEEAVIRRDRMDLQPVDDEQAERFYVDHHYLCASKHGGSHLGLFARPCDGDDAEPLALLTLSAFDLTHLASALPAGIDFERTLVLSRIATTARAPRNTFTHLLSRTMTWLRSEQPQVRLLLTYLDPNLGFTGASYRAASWWLFAEEAKERYLYLDSSYVTDREMLRAWGTNDFDHLRSMLGPRIERSKHTLAPLQVLGHALGSGGARLNRARLAEPSSTRLTPHRV